MNLEEQANKLQKEAFNIIELLRLHEILSPVGEVKLIGSVPLNLMTWRDIDIHTISESRPNRKQAIEFASKLYENQGIRKITCIDYDDHRISKNIENKPKGQYIGSEYVDDNGNQWKIDIWLLNEEDSTSKVIRDVSEGERRVILDIKNNFHSHPLYRNKITSIDIYEAVLDRGVNSVVGFSDYLKQKGLDI